MSKQALEAIARSIRSLSMDGVQAAESGHPGLPLGCAELGAVLWGRVLAYQPLDPQWLNRDRFVLSAGHGSMFLYSALHLAGYELSLDDLGQFRQLHSKTPGHPERGRTPGVETSTGPLGAGFSNAVGMAMAETILAARYNTQDHTIIDHYTYCLVGDGCLMEGISYEAGSFAGHQRLGKLVVFYDSNRITIEGSTELSFTEDVAQRFRAMGWQVLEGSMYEFQALESLIQEAKAEKNRPSLVILNSVIGMGSVSKAGTHGVHGTPLGAEEIVKTKAALGIPPQSKFWVDPLATSYMAKHREDLTMAHRAWQETFQAWTRAHPSLAQELKDCLNPGTQTHDIPWPHYGPGEDLATRVAGGRALQALAKALPNFLGGSADLAPSNNTALGLPDYDWTNRLGRTIHFGVREHAMAGIVNGLCLYGGLRVFCSTFLVFADYLRPAIRLAALMELPVTYVLTHDSFYVGEDGPTHQPIETLTSLRIIPGVKVFRPADAEETNLAWDWEIHRAQGPVVVALSRQNLRVQEKTANWYQDALRGAHVLVAGEGDLDLVLVATGSELSLAMEVAKASGLRARVVSMPCRELFLEQDLEFRERILPRGIRVVVLEAGIPLGWECIGAKTPDIVGIHHFGESAKPRDLQVHLGFTVEGVLAKLRLKGSTR